MKLGDELGDSELVDGDGVVLDEPGALVVLSVVAGAAVLGC
ncbi:hypothetical protein [Aquabacterium sp.]|nr:hypothetical protein [Aquabacterium sp.]HSW06809.1 hypothetical protein [Aquabacterium sp.]